mmetsp:Transcript_12240/g.26404  ORF Transcript_12240/g.26404 Transcript_12240/m.26404 type:complete len:276 (+) Transcript_12240:136-963(+)
MATTDRSPSAPSSREPFALPTSRDWGLEYDTPSASTRILHSTTTTSTTTDDSSRSSYISNQDLAAMKAMVQEIKLNPSLLHSKCNIPQLSHSMTTRHQERMAATTATSIPSCHAAQEQQLEWSRQQWCIDQQQQQQQLHVHGYGDATHHNDQCYHPIHNNCNTNFDSSFEIDRHFPVTPPLLPKSENIHKFPTITPLTQDTALLSYQRHHSIEQQQYEQHRQQQRSSAIPPPPFATSYCQESNTRATAAMPMPPLSSQIGLDSCGQGQRSTSCHR